MKNLIHNSSFDTNVFDFLVLVSPASLRSEWVLIELGGAIALEKTIIPILLYVGVNEIPQIINLKLARDINDVDSYYSEITSRIAGKPIQKRKPKKRIERFKIGDEIRIIDHVPEDLIKGDYIADWERDMDKYLGQTTKINKVWGDGTYCLEIDKADRGGGFIYAEEWLTKI